MIVSDTSSLMALVMDEQEAPEIRGAIAEAGQILISAATLVEFYVAAMGKGDGVYARAQEMLAELPIVIVPFDAEQAEIVRLAYEQYGKGRRHPAQLNFGDTFSYALAKAQGLPLLFKGNDFGQTDVAVVL